MVSKNKIIVIVGCIWLIFVLGLYFYVFHNGLSEQSSDWGSFGGYISGVVTVPFSILSAYFLFQTYKDADRTYKLAVEEKQINVAHQAIKEAGSFLELALDGKITMDDDELSFREINYNPKVTREIMQYIASDTALNTHYRVTVGKAFLCLYDFLVSSEIKIGQTDVIRLYKIRYQWIISLHNEYKLEIIEHREHGVFSEDIKKYFYNT